MDNYPECYRVYYTDAFYISVFYKLSKSYFISFIRTICTKYTKNQQEINIPKDKKNNQKKNTNPVVIFII